VGWAPQLTLGLAACLATARVAATPARAVRGPTSGGAGLNEELGEREVIEDIWNAYLLGEVVTALVKATEVGAAITAMRWASKLAGLRHATEIAGFERREVLVWEPPYPEQLSRFGDDPAMRLLMFRPTPPVRGARAR
jgi:hypothetical protein